MNLREWKYTAKSQYGRLMSGPYTINENMTGAVLGDQKAARINFRTALLIVWGWNQLGDMKYRLVVPNPTN